MRDLSSAERVARARPHTARAGRAAVRGAGARRAAGFLAAAAVCGMLGGCGGLPRLTAHGYLRHLKHSDYAACYGMLSKEDQVARTLEQFLTAIPLAPAVGTLWFKAILQSMTFQLGELRARGEMVIVPVRVTMPDLPRWERAIYAAGNRNGAASTTADESLETGDFPRLVYQDEIVLVWERRHWRVFADLAEKHRIEQLHAAGLLHYHRQEYDQALAAYREILHYLGGKHATGNLGLLFFYRRELKQIEAVKAELPRSRSYISRLVLNEVRVAMSASRAPAVFGKIINAGDRAVDDVQMTVTYYEGDQLHRKAVFSETHTPVVTPIEFSDFSHAVLPLVAGEARDFGFVLSAPPEIQQKATPVVTVTSIAFTHVHAPLPRPPAPPPAQRASASGPRPSAAGTPAPENASSGAPKNRYDPASSAAAPAPSPTPSEHPSSSHGRHRKRRTG